jgi:hypothetical protein
MLSGPSLPHHLFFIDRKCWWDWDKSVFTHGTISIRFQGKETHSRHLTRESKVKVHHHYQNLQKSLVGDWNPYGSSSLFM